MQPPADPASAILKEHDGRDGLAPGVRHTDLAVVTHNRLQRQLETAHAAIEQEPLAIAADLDRRRVGLAGGVVVVRSGLNRKFWQRSRLDADIPPGDGVCSARGEGATKSKAPRAHDRPRKILCDEPLPEADGHVHGRFLRRIEIEDRRLHTNGRGQHPLSDVVRASNKARQVGRTTERLPRHGPPVLASDGRERAPLVNGHGSRVCVSGCSDCGGQDACGYQRRLD